jgi:hypothetical protein
MTNDPLRAYRSGTIIAIVCTVLGQLIHFFG